MTYVILLWLIGIAIFVMGVFYGKNRIQKQNRRLAELAAERARTREQEREKDRAQWVQNSKTVPTAGFKVSDSGPAVNDRRRSSAERAAGIRHK